MYKKFQKLQQKTARKYWQIQESCSLHNQHTEICHIHIHWQQNIWKRIEENCPIHNSIRTVKYLGITLTKEVYDLYNGKYQTQDFDKTNWRWHVQWKESLCSWKKGIDIVKMSILSQTIYRFNGILFKTAMAFFTEVGKKKTN